MNKLRHMLAGFGAGLIVASLVVQLTGSSGGPKENEPSRQAQLDERQMKKWAEENGYQLVGGPEKASQAASPQAAPSASPAANGSASPQPVASPASQPTASPASSAAPSAKPSLSPVQTPTVSEPAAPAEPKSVTIPEGVNSTQVVGILADAGIVDKTAFEQALIQAQASTKIRSGTYLFKPGEDMAKIIDELTKIPKLTR